LLDKKSVDLILDYNHNINSQAAPSYSNENVNITKLSSDNKADLGLLSSVESAVNMTSTNVANILESPTIHNSANSTDDGKGHANPVKYVDYSKSSRSNYQTSQSDLQSLNTSSLPSSIDENNGTTFKFKDNKSPNLGFLSSEKNVRLIDNVSPSKFNASLSKGNNNLEDIVTNITGESVLPNTYNLYSMSQNS
jgi:hypothetical protein